MQASDALRDQPPEIRNAIASGWMKRGIALLNENTPASLTESLRWFERAIEIRRALPLHENDWYRYVLAAGWMNRGDALTRLGLFENLAEALRSYDAALALLQTLELDHDPRFRKRAAIAWMNRGITLQAQSDATAALVSFDHAIAALRSGPTEYSPILASGLTNRASALLLGDPPLPDLAREAAEEALRLIAPVEKHELVAAETGLKARHILCRALAAQMFGSVTEELIGPATDAVEDGIKLARHWEARGEYRFRDLAVQLFDFGARVYQIHQPHFLAEFLLENLDPAQAGDALASDRQMHRVAGEAISRAFGRVHREGFSEPGRMLRRLRPLRLAAARLQELRRHHSLGAAGEEIACP